MKRHGIFSRIALSLHLLASLGYGAEFESGPLTSVNSLFVHYDNRAPYGGGAHRATLMSCTVADNVAGTSGGGTWSCTVRNSIVLDNTLASGATANWAGTSTFQYTCTTPVPKGAGNFNAAPPFVGQADGSRRAYMTNF